MAVKEGEAAYTKEQLSRAAAIKALFFDVDGVLTDGKITYDDAGRELKSFHVRDGLIIHYLKKAGLVVGILTGRESSIVSKRAAELKLDFCHQGLVDKYSVFEKLVTFHKLKKREVAYVGDDLNDLRILEACGLSACPADAPSYIRSRVDVVTQAKGGRGVVREVGDLLLTARGELAKMLKN